MQGMKAMPMKHILLLLASALCASAVFEASAQPLKARPVAKKYIACGFEFGGSVTASNLLDHAEKYENIGIDGTVLDIRAPMPDGKVASTYMTVRDMRPWPVDLFAGEVGYLNRLTSSTTFRELFIRSFRAPRKRIDWLDDNVWTIIAGHMRAIAWAAKRGGCRGLHIDHEDYFAAKQFMRQKAEIPWEELAEVARRRGREVFKPVFDEFPEAVMFFYRFMVADPGFWNYYATATDPVAAMKAKGDLWIPFMNGLLDVMPWTAKVVEGDETGYRYESKYNWFHFARNLQRNCAQRLVDESNLDKFRARTSTSFPVYLDAYTDDSYTPDREYYRGPVEGARAIHLERNLAQATEASDEYVWLFCEKRSWIRWEKKPDGRMVDDARTWPEMFIGIGDVLKANKDPGKFMAECLKNKGKYEDVFNDSLYSHWRRKDKRPGTFAMDSTVGDGDNSSYRATGVESGCFQCSVPAKCGEYFLIEFSVKNAGGDWCRANIASNEKDLLGWLIPGYAITLGEPNADGWRKGTAFVRVPDFGKAVSFTAGFSLAEGESAYIDNVHFYKVIPLLKDGFAPAAGKTAK